MYPVIAIGLMVILPLVSLVIELMLTQGADVLLLVGKWFTFWGVGIRLLIAGISQTLRPGFTAKGIFEIEDPRAEAIVSELGFANLGFGLIGLLSLPFPAFLLPAAIAGGLFLALDGIKHVFNRNRSRNENIALVTDLAVALAAAIYVASVIF